MYPLHLIHPPWIIWQSQWAAAKVRPLKGFGILSKLAMVYTVFFSSYINSENFCIFSLHPSSHSIVFPGDSVHRRRLQATSANGLPHGPAPTDAALLAEGEKSSAQIQRCCLLLG